MRARLFAFFIMMVLGLVFAPAPFVNAAPVAELLAFTNQNLIMVEGESHQGRENVQKRLEAKKRELRAELEGLAPEERQARIRDLRAEHKLKHEERLSDFRKRWGDASPEVKEEFCINAKERCAAVREKGRSCDLAIKVCSSLDGVDIPDIPENGETENTIDAE